MKTFFVITGKVGDKTVYWQKWADASIKGRPKWVVDINSDCLFANENLALKTACGKGSSHWHTVFGRDPMTFKGTDIKDITVRPATLTIQYS